MAAKQLIFNQEAQNALVRGVDIVADAVKKTLGPKGRNVVIQSQSGPIVTKDGVTVAKSIELECPYEDLGAQLCKQVSSKTNDVAGDGTTTATVLAQAIMTSGLKAIGKIIIVAQNKNINIIKAIFFKFKLIYSIII